MCNRVITKHHSSSEKEKQKQGKEQKRKAGKLDHTDLDTETKAVSGKNIVLEEEVTISEPKIQSNISCGVFAHS